MSEDEAGVDTAGEEAHAEVLLGRVLSGRYRLLSLLGQGGSSLVFVAEHVRTHRHFAVKLLNPDLVSRGPALRRFRAEAELAGAIVNEHVVSILDYDVDNGLPYLVMELLRGQSLRSLLQQEGTLELSRVLGLMLQCCEGVHAAHVRGLVHRDLKPENLFVTRRADGSELVKVLDFGVAKSAVAAEGAEQTKNGTLVGTTRYMAPEQLRNPSNVDARADVYALGLVLYEMLAARPAFAPGDLHAEMQQVLFEAPTPLSQLRSNLPSALVACVERAIAREPGGRPGSVRAFQQVLREGRYLRSTTAVTPADEPLVSLPRPPRDSLHDVAWRPPEQPRQEADPPTVREVVRRSFGIVRLSLPLILSIMFAGLVISAVTCLPR